MRARAHAFLAASLDGFIARPDGGLDWLLQRHAQAPAGEDFGYAEFFARMDALVMGRGCYEAVQGFEPWPYGDKPVWVCSRRPLQLLPGKPLQQTAEPLAALLERLGGQGVRQVYLDGGQLVRSALREGLLDSLTLTVIPVLLGQGRTLWGALPGDVGLQLEAATPYPACGFVQLRYRVNAGRIEAVAGDP